MPLRLYRQLLDQAVEKCKTTAGRVKVDSVFTSLMLPAQTQSRWMDSEVILGFLGKSVQVKSQAVSSRDESLVKSLYPLSYHTCVRFHKE